MKFTTKTLGKICDEEKAIIQTGPFGSQLHQSEYTEEGTPVIMPKNIIDGQISTDGIARVNKENVERLSRHKVKKGDIVYGRRGNIGRHAIITNNEAGWLCGTGCIRISIKGIILDSIFLHYYLNQNEVVNWIYNHAIGATMPNLNTSIIRSIPIKYPTIDIQKKIANILWTYDELIRKNDCRIQILENISESIYRDWFVLYNYPKNQISNKRALIPDHKYWKEYLLKDLVTFEKGIEPGSKNYLEEPENDTVPFLRVGNLGDRSEKIFVNRKLARNKFLQKSDIALTLDGTVGRVKMGLEGCYSTGIRKVTIKKATSLNRSFLYYLLKSENIQSVIKAHARGTTILHASSAIDYMRVILPPQSLLELFDEKISSMLCMVQNLTDQNSLLRKVRDLLTSKLISGQINFLESVFSNEGD